MKIFVINLKSSADRRRIMEKQLKAMGLPYEIFDAVRGADMSESEILEYYDHDYYHSRPGYFTLGAVGCSLSHYFIYQRIVEEKIEKALILEDDMLLGKQLPDILRQIDQRMRSDEVIMLFYQSYSPINLSAETREPLNNKFSLYQVAHLKGLMSTAAYVIGYETAKKMHENLLPLINFADDWISYYNREMLNGVRVVYPFLLNNTYLATTISPNKKGGSFIKKIVPFVEKNKLFPFYQFLKYRRRKFVAKTRQCFVVNTSPEHLRNKGQFEGND